MGKRSNYRKAIAEIAKKEKKKMPFRAGWKPEILLPKGSGVPGFCGFLGDPLGSCTLAPLGKLRSPPMKPTVLKNPKGAKPQIWSRRQAKIPGIASSRRAFEESQPLGSQPPGASEPKNNNFPKPQNKSLASLPEGKKIFSPQIFAETQSSLDTKLTS